MNATRTSLRLQIGKWLGPISSKTVRITRSDHTGDGRVRCISVEALRQNSTLSIVFFRHGDGSWLIYPPEVERPAMGAYLRAA
jgi:hypothetical protein